MHEIIATLVAYTRSIHSAFKHGADRAPKFPSLAEDIVIVDI